MKGFKMIAVLLAVTFVSANCFSIVSDNGKNVTKRDTNSDTSVIFPDLRSRDLEEIGQRKKKTFKRLALPVSFVLRPVAEPEGEDYYSQGGGESDDNYENKDWSDINRPPVENARAIINHTDLTDIEGISHSIKVPNQGSMNEKQKNKKTHRNSEIVIVDDIEEKEEPQVTELSKEETKTTQSSSREEEDDYADKIEKTERPKTASEEEEEKRAVELIEKEKAEAEAKKQRILSEVDDLKARHEKEQRQIILSEKLKEDEIFKEEQERDRQRVHSSYNKDKYGHSLKSIKSTEYEDYPELDSVEDKYKINPVSKTTSTSTTTRGTKRPTRRKQKKEKIVEQSSGKLSVFKNPRAYMVYDDYYESPEPSTTSSTTEIIVSEPRTTSVKYSARYTDKDTKTTPNIEEHERISLVPEDDETKAGEPTLFFPIKRKNKHRKKVKYDATAYDSIVAETVTDSPVNTTSSSVDPTGTGSGDASNTSTTPIGVSAYAESAITSLDTSSAPDSSSSVTAADSPITAADSSVTAADSPITAADSSVTAAEASSPVSESSSPSASISGSSPSASAEDAERAEAMLSYIHKKEEKPQDYKHEHGGHKSHQAEHHESHGEDGKKAYKGYHADTKAEKGHHDKEDHSGEYHDAAGYNKHHEKASKHYGDHQHEEHGKKQAKYEESGKHSKGHSTKGSHDIHKKEEYEKKVEFFEEEGDSAEEEKKGGHHEQNKHGKGGFFKTNKLDTAHHHKDKGDGAKFEKGGHHLYSEGHKKTGGHDNHHKHGVAQAYAAGKDSGKKWVYHHGYPAKTANLVIIDRRGDKYTHGPQYFG